MDTLRPSQQSSSGSGDTGTELRPGEIETVLGPSGRSRRRRTRRRNTGLRRLLLALEPIGLVCALCILSMGVIAVVEGTVETKAEVEDAQRSIEARENMRAEVRELAETLDSGWAPSFQEGEDIFFAAEFAAVAADVAPFSGLPASPDHALSAEKAPEHASLRD